MLYGRVCVVCITFCTMCRFWVYAGTVDLSSGRVCKTSGTKTNILSFILNKKSKVCVRAMRLIQPELIPVSVALSD